MNERAQILELLRRGASVNIIGDSIAAGMGCSGGHPTEETLLVCGDDRYTRWYAPNAWWVTLSRYLSEKFPGTHVENHGCSGIYSYQLCAGLGQVVSGKEDIVLILVGANDRKREHGREELEQGLCGMVDRFRAQGAIPVLISPNPSTVHNEMHPSRLFHMEDVVNIIQYAAWKKDVLYADCYGTVLGYMADKGCGIEELMTQPGCMSDGLHPTDRVQEIMADCILRTLGLAPKISDAKW